MEGLQNRNVEDECQTFQTACLVLNLCSFSFTYFSPMQVILTLKGTEMTKINNSGCFRFKQPVWYETTTLKSQKG